MRRILTVGLCMALLMGCYSGPSKRAADKGPGRLRRAVAGADRLRVRTGGTCHRDISSEYTLCELAGAGRVSDFVKHLKFSGFGGGCKCCGEPTFEFYRGKELLAMVSLHHGVRLRWREGWPGDGYLTDRSRDWLVNWLADRGIDEPKEEAESARQMPRVKMPPDLRRVKFPWETKR